MARWSTAPPLCSPSGDDFLYRQGNLRPIGMTDREFQDRARLFQALFTYMEETGRYAEWVGALSPGEQDAYYQLTRLFVDYWARVQYLIDSVPYTGEVWHTGGLGTGASFIPRWYNETDRDPEVTAACADLCVSSSERDYVLAGGKGCDVKWQNDCFFLSRPPHTWGKKIAGREFGCGQWKEELNQAWGDLQEVVAAIDELHGEALYIDPKTGLSTAELIGAVIDYNETAHENMESAYEWPGLGPFGTEWNIDTWIALGIAAVVVAVVVK